MVNSYDFNSFLFSIFGKKEKGFDPATNKQNPVVQPSPQTIMNILNYSKALFVYDISGVKTGIVMN